MSAPTTLHRPSRRRRGLAHKRLFAALGASWRGVLANEHSIAASPTTERAADASHSRDLAPYAAPGRLRRPDLLPSFLECLSDAFSAIGLPAFARPGGTPPKTGALLGLEEINGERYLVISRAERDQLRDAMGPIARLLELFGQSNPRGNVVHSGTPKGGWRLSFALGTT